MKAICYESNTGFTKEYAKLLGQKLSLPVVPFANAKKALAKGDEIIYMGWIMGGSIKNLEKARRLFSIPVVCAVGMSMPGEQIVKDLRARHHYGEYDTTALFYLQGGCNPSQLKGLNKMMINMVKTALEKSITSNAPSKEDDQKMLEMINHGKSMVKEENLDPVLEFVNTMG